MPIDECCQYKSFNEFCDDCRTGLMLFVMMNRQSVMTYLKTHNHKLYREIREATYQI